MTTINFENAAVFDGESPDLHEDASVLVEGQWIREQALAGLDIMQRAGLKIGFGTDLLGPQHTRQCSEFALRRQALKPADILRSATSVNAEILQMKGELGVVKPGALADLLLVNGDPLKNLDLLEANGAHLSIIMKDGCLLKRLA